jgi:hypothetical protein
MGVLRIFIFIKSFLLLFFFLISPAAAGFFDFDAKGWVEGTYYPPHNEFDPSPGLSFDKRRVARYAMEANLEITHKDIDRLFLFTEPKLFFGDTRPQISYTHNFTPNVLYFQYGAGIVLSKSPNIQLRIAHGEWIKLNNYKGEQLLWNGIKLRWTFDTK